MKSYESMNPYLVRGGYDKPPKPLNGVPAESPTLNEIKRAAVVIRRYCISRRRSPAENCPSCPIRDICMNEPHLWGSKHDPE